MTAEHVEREMSIEDEFTRRDESIKKLFLELQASAYGFASTYTAVIIFGGYAGLFTIWSNVKEYLKPPTVFWVGLLIGISMMTFVAFEVFKMIVMSKEMMSMRSLITGNISPEERDVKRQAIAQKSNRFLSRILIPIWIGSLAIAVISGFGAGCLLMYTFIKSIAGY